MRNIELKARYPDLDQGRALAGALGAEDMGLDHQVDTYCRCDRGRLKLRQSSLSGTTLIWYDRQDRAHARGSDYLLLPIPDGDRAAELFRRALDVRLVVDKQRHIFIHDHVRIHLDQVKGLGSFLEFEAVLDHGRDDAWGNARVAALTEHFRIAPTDVVPGSYADLLGATPA